MWSSSVILWGKHHHHHCLHCHFSIKASTLCPVRVVSWGVRKPLLSSSQSCQWNCRKGSDLALVPAGGQEDQGQAWNRWVSDDGETESLTELVWTGRLRPLSPAPRTANHPSPAGFSLVKARSPGKTFISSHRRMQDLLGLNLGWRLANRVSARVFSSASLTPFLNTCQLSVLLVEPLPVQDQVSQPGNQ